MERALALRDVMDHAVRVQREISGAKRIGPSRAPMIWALLVCVPLLAFSAYSYLARPAFIWGAPAALPPERMDANVRVALFMLAQRIEAFRAEAGHFPVALGDIGEAVEGVRYSVLSDAVFELRAEATGGAAVVFRSDQPVDAFLGNSIVVIQGHQTR